jgi:peptide-methionine (S)-S-oxide reductase
MVSQRELATLGGGCFWCLEAVFQDLVGVERVVSGYAGGHVANPSYAEVCRGITGHAEVVQLTYDPEIITFSELLEIFWHVHDPTTLNRQGADVGTQYRSIILYHDEQQRQIAERSRREAEAAGVWPEPIVTEIVALDTFYPAEAYHQNYYLENPNQPYCRVVIDPKVRKFRQSYAHRLKK